MELWDAYDRNFKKIEGITLIRGEESSIPKGIYHMVVLILVRHVDGQYLLMRRSPGKAYPLYWEATAGGSVLQGESVILQEGETCDYKWADKEEILAMGDDELLAQTMRKYVI